MLNYHTIRYELKNKTGWIYLNREEARNSLSGLMLDELDEVFTVAEKDSAVRVLVLTAKGKTFCAGADLKEILEGLEKPRTEQDFLDRAHEVFSRLRVFPKPTIAALNGLTLAGGLELAMCCDIIIAAESARIGDAHANYGNFPGGGGAAILPRKIGPNRAKFMLFTGDSVSVTEMKECGLVNKIVPDADLERVVDELSEKISSKSPLGLRLMKQVVDQSIDLTEKAALVQEHLSLRRYMRSYDLREGLLAFGQKRKPEFKGC